jgi:peptidoglycan/xylan/chitin deacetylase (PgdA/CDA1 family)
LRRELESCSLAIEQATGETPRYYRPPFGLANHALRRVTRILALEVVGWQVRGLDTPGSDPETVAARILARVRPGGVVLLHDGGRDPAKVVAATRAVLDGLEALKLEPVRLDRLLEE